MWIYKCMLNVYKNQQNRQTGSRNLMGPKSFPRYRVPIWSLWPNIRFLPSIVAEKNVTKNVHICSMCIKTNQIGKQEVGIWRVQKRYPQYGIPMWCLWPNIRFCHQQLLRKMRRKISWTDGRTEGRKNGRMEGGKDRRTEIKLYTPSPSGNGGIIMLCY